MSLHSSIIGSHRAAKRRISLATPGQSDVRINAIREPRTMMANSSTETRTVFLVDDDSSSVDLYSKGLEQAGFKTAAALDAAKAREALENLSPDLIILDLMLPQRGGLELLQAIRADIRHKNTPILVLSNAYLPDITQKALRSGGNKALVRSECTSSELVSISREMLGI